MHDSPKKRSSHRNAPRADKNEQCDAIITQTSPSFRNYISNLIHASVPKQLLEATDKTNDRSAASRKPLSHRELPSADEGPIEAELDSVIAGQCK